MRRYFAILGLTVLLLIVFGCVTSVQRIFDKDFAMQQNQKEIDSMFPGEPELYDWLKGDFIQNTVSGTRALSQDVQFGYRIDEPRTNIDINCVYVRSSLSFLGFFDKKDEYMSHFGVQDKLVVNFAREHGYTVKKYKFGFTERLFKQLGLKNITLFQNPVNMRYGYSYVILNEGTPFMIYFPVIYGNFSNSKREVTSYEWDAVFISTRESIRFLDSLPNSFIDDMNTQ
ncbi:hypothetical protein LJC36_01295 [Desulfovibrio sp. OttesenSCG-928-C14]|nr:hypothetical protein [Desulfovibrio sp. OttesenSCG-928-C14]